VIQTVSFIKTFKTPAQAEAYTRLLSGKSFIIQLWDSEAETSLFAVCDGSGLNSMIEAFRDADPQQDHKE
jgi:lysophospholipid acyltransferase (LPLAT)-like uncharacterized protein